MAERTGFETDQKPSLKSLVFIKKYAKNLLNRGINEFIEIFMKWY